MNTTNIPILEVEITPADLDTPPTRMRITLERTTGGEQDGRDVLHVENLITDCRGASGWVRSSFIMPMELWANCALVKLALRVLELETALTALTDQTP